MTVLSIDSAGPVVGIALYDGGTEGVFFEQRIVRGAEVALAQALAEHLPKAQIDLVCVSVGPGAFTSLRVGVAAALGVAIARKVPVLPLGSLYARALMAPQALVLALLDGRKGKAYAALYRDGVCVQGPVDVPPEQALAMPQGEPFVAVGEGALVWSEQVVAAGGQVHARAGTSPVGHMGAAALTQAAQAIPPQAVTLRYLRQADAKLPKGAVPTG